MLQVIVAGLAFGAVYALSAGGIVLTYVSSGVLNFAYAAIAFFIARFYYYLLVQETWNQGLALAASLGASFALGLVLWILIFRPIRLASQLIRIVVTIGLSVSLPAAAILFFGDFPISNPPGIAPEPVSTYKIFGAVVSLDQIIIYACGIVILGGGWLVLRRTPFGLMARAVVDSEAMASLTGVHPTRVAAIVSTFSTFTAGLVGILSAPLFGLDISSMSVLLAAAFAAAVVGQLRNLGISVAVGVLIGLATMLVERYLPSSSELTTAIIPSIPFGFLALYLLYAAVFRKGAGTGQVSGGALDRAIAPQGGSEIALARAAAVARRSSAHWWRPAIGPVISLVLLVVLVFQLSDVWVAAIGLGVAYAIVFLSHTLTAGEGGLIWLCQITFAGIGALTSADLFSRHGWSPLLAVLGGAVLAGVFGLISLVTVRLGELYVALVTLSFGLLVQNLIFQRQTFFQGGNGISISRPGFAADDRSFVWLVLVVFVVAGLLIELIRRSTFGLAASAVRFSEPGARSIGLNVVGTKIALSIFGACLAGLGGGFLAMSTFAAVPDNFNVIIGLTWLAVVVSVGITSNIAALVAGLTMSVVPQLFTSYLSPWWSQVPPVLFGLGAIMVARNPEGVVAMHARQIEQLLSLRKPKSDMALIIDDETRIEESRDSGEPVEPAAEVTAIRAGQR